MKHRGLILAALALLAPVPALAQTMTPVAALKPLEFLVGRWEGGGRVADGGESAQGASTISVEANGRVLLRQDRNTVFDKTGKATQSFGQVMMIYAEADGVRADYADGEGHVIHYGPAAIVAGSSVEFASSAPPGAPVFRLRYEARGPNELRIAFAVRPPGQAAFQPIADGVVHRVSAPR